MKRVRTIISAVVIFLLIKCTWTDTRQNRDIFGDLPRIVTHDGNLVFQTGTNRNIQFLSAAGGQISIDGEDVKTLSQNVKRNKEAISRWNMSTTGIPSVLENRMTQLERRFNNSLGSGIESSFGQRLVTLERNIPDSLIHRLTEVEETLRNLQSPNNAQQRLNELADRLSSVENRVTNLHNTPSSTPAPAQTVNLVRLRTRMVLLEMRVRNLRRLLRQNDCNNNPCRNGGTCVDMYNGYTCRCSSAWKGATCEEDVNECAEYASTNLGCQNGATCINMPGMFRCQCTANWHGVRCSEHHDDCTGASGLALCGHGTCINRARVQEGQAKYTCICDAGWTTGNNDPACVVDIDECSGREQRCSMDPQVQCINLPGTFHCGSCPTGFSGDGFSCVDINECTTNNGGCSLAPRVDCVNTRGSRQCRPCPPGFQGNGVYCNWVGICNVNNGGCYPLAICREMPGISGRSCSCPQGYVGNGEGSSGCMQQGPVTGPCASAPCLNGGACRTSGSTFLCACQPGYGGQRCQTNVDECANNPCQHRGTCVDGVNTYTCQCTSSFTGQNCQDQVQVCGGRREGESGSITFPQQRGTDYPDNINCAWRIYSTPGKIITLHFDRFALEQHTNCNYDYLEIHDGPSASSYMIGKYCGNGLPNGGNINSTRHQLYVWFFSDDYGGGEGFSFRWTSSLASCGGDMRGTDHGTINSPGYPGNYPHNRTCVWTVTVSPNHAILFSFAFLAIETHRNCSYDLLEIRDGLADTSPLLHRYCNSSTPPPLRTTGPTAYVKFHSDGGLNDRGFHVTYSALQQGQGGQQCGARLTADSGEIKSPNFPNAYHHDASCIWIITVSERETIKLSFKAMDLEHHVNCQYDYVEVRDGIREDSPLIARYCGNNVPTPLMTSSNAATIHFRSDSSDSGTGFRLMYTVSCGGTFSAEAGTIQSPYYPDAYPSDKDCIYLLSQPSGYSVSLIFTTFDIESGTSDDNCDFDYLEVRDGEGRDSQLVGRYCGNQLPPPVSSSQNFLWLKFISDGSTQNLGFQANYSQITGGCGGTLRNDHGQVTSPGHPNSYPHGVNCEWLITVTPGLVIRLTFHTFTMEMSSSCHFDYVAIYDNTTVSSDSMIGKYCGRNAPPVLTSSENTLLVVLKSDSSIAHEGFMATYIALNASHVCGSDLRNDVGIITSPNYPSNYPHHRQCTWTIVAPHGNQVLLNITDFRLERHSGCRYDSLEIRNGGYASSPMIGKYCGTTIDNIIVSHSNRLWLQFKTDSSRTYRGFRMEYDTTSTGCGTDFTTPTGSFMSPNYPMPYSQNSECFWTITISQGSRIQLVFVDFELERHSTCGYDYVMVRDGGPAGSQIAQLCGQQIPDPINSISNRLWIKYKTDFSQNFRGFRAFYSTLCNLKLTDFRGVIESPNFPRSYPHRRNCTWMIESTLGNTLNISFSHLDIESHYRCQHDYVRISNVQNNDVDVIGTYCGTNLPPLITSSGMNLKVEFRTDYSVAGSGFRLEYLTDGCGGELTGATGNFTSPGYPEPYPHRRLCHWIITVDTGKYIELTIDDFDLESHTTCRFDVLEVYNGGSVAAPLLTQLCHQQKTAQIVTSTGNVLFVRFASDSSIAGNGFSAHYREMAGGCGGNFSTPTATIMSRNYPNNYPHNTNCEWLITVREGRSIILTFEDFAVEGSNTCRYDYVVVNDGQNGTQLMKHCGNTMPSPVAYQSSGNQMYIHMRTDPTVSAKGFKANYILGCGGTINVNDDGAVTSPNYPDVYDSNHNCTWILRADHSDDRITLSFTHMDTAGNENCEADYIMVFDGDDALTTPIGTYCGNTIPTAITSRGSALTLLFVSDYNHVRTGFRAVYSKSIATCGGDITAESGSFLSPGYPVNYPANIECVWSLHASPGNKILVSFSTFSLEEHEYCNLDYVELREGDVTGRLIGRYCGHSIPSNITAANGVWIKFRSDEDGTDNGFIAQFNSVYGGDIYGVSGQIASPLYPRHYPSNVDYTWTVTTEIGMRIQVTIVTLDMDGAYHRSTCLYDYLKLLDGGSEDSPEIGQYCMEIPSPFISTTNQLRLLFHSDRSMSGQGFLLNWEATSLMPVSTVAPETVTPGCGGTLRANETLQTLISPGYPDGYAANLDCTWTVSTTVGNHIWANVTDIDTESHHRCHYDSVTFLERFYMSQHLGHWNRSIGNFCGRTGSTTPSNSMTNIMLINFKTDGSVNGTGFSLDFKSVCGGVMRNGVGRISSPDYPGNYPANTNCTWVIWIKTHRTIQLEFNRTFSIDGTAGSCAGDYIEIRNGASTTSPPINNSTNGRFCGNTRPIIVESGSNLVFLRFISDELGSGAGFALSYSEIQLTCGGYMSLTSQIQEGLITSPNYPENYPHNVDCTWIITAPATDTIQLDFEDVFTVEGASTCRFDFVRIRDGGTVNSHILANFCGSVMPQSTRSTGNVAFVRFRSDGTISNKGFKLRYKITTCGGRLNGQRGIISSPNYPMNYGNDADCEWYIMAPHGHFITLTFDFFRLQSSSSNCSADFLEIRDFNSTGPILMRRCGQYSHLSSIRSSDSFMYIHFQSDASRTNRGFRLTFEASVEECGGDLTTPTGTFTSPNFPGYYPHARRCEWRIQVPQGRRVMLSFANFDVGNSGISTSCFHDYVAVYNGLFEDSPMISRSCGSTIPDPVKSSENTMRVIFVTDGYGSNNGFSATYSSQNEAVCGGTLSSSPGEVSSPGYGTGNYSNNLQCVWQIQNVGPNSTIAINIDDLRFEEQLVAKANGCQFDFMEIKEGHDETGITLGSFCSNQTIQNPILTPSSIVWMRFKTDHSTVAEGFHLTYRFVDCGGILLDTSGRIMSPNYPQSFGPNQFCAWNIIAPEATQIVILFTDFNIQDANNCSDNSLEILNGGYPTSPSIGKFCGTDVPTTFRSQSHAVRLIFRSGSQVTSGGFQLFYNFATEGCGGLYHGKNGSVMSPNYPSSYPHNTECIWDINVENGYNINLDFLPPFDLQGSSSCQSDYVQVFDVSDDGISTQRGRWCSNLTPPSQKSTSNRMQVKFHSDASVNGNGFKAIWNTSCGGVLTGDSGTFISPGYPVAYTNGLECNYTIQADSQKYIMITFDDEIFDVEGPSCRFDYIAVYRSNASANSWPLARVCGRVAPQPISGIGSLFIRFVTDMSLVGHGFKARYTTTQCGGEFTGPSGDIETPSHPTSYHDNSNCTWLITVQEDRAVELKFTKFQLEVHSGCMFDYVEIHDGENLASPLIGRYCGSVTPDQIRTSSNKMLVHFVTDASISLEGFKASYWQTFGELQGCGGVLNSTSGSFASVDNDGDGRYENDLDCQWTIIVGDNKIAKLNFASFDIEQAFSGECSYDYVKVYDGFSTTDPLIGTYCGSTVPMEITATSNFLFVHFYSDSLTTRGGITATYSQDDALCGGTLTASARTQILTSPGFPNPVSQTIRCRWVIDTPEEDQQVRLTLTQLNLISDSTCINEYLEFRDSPLDDIGQSIHSCGTQNGASFDSIGRTVQVNFATLASSLSQGFSLNYMIANCNRTLTANTGRISSPGWPRNYPTRANCETRIQSAVGTTLSLYFNSFMIEPHSNCVFDYLQIHNGSSMSDSIINKLCDVALPNPIFLTGNSVLLKFVTDYSVTHSGYDITYTATTQGVGCGGNLTGINGSLTSPGYPGNYSDQAVCTWLIAVPIRRVVTVTFTDIRIMGTMNCDNDYVEVYNGDSQGALMFGRYCGVSEITASLRAAGNMVFVKFVSSGTGNPPIFRMVYFS